MKPEAITYVEHKKKPFFRDVKEAKIKTKERNHIENIEILVHLEKTKKELSQAYDNLNFVLDADLIDSYIYEVKAMQVKYDYLLKKAKERGLIQDIQLEVYKF